MIQLCTVWSFQFRKLYMCKVNDIVFIVLAELTFAVLFKPNCVTHLSVFLTEIVITVLVASNLKLNIVDTFFRGIVHAVGVQTASYLQHFDRELCFIFSILFLFVLVQDWNHLVHLWSLFLFCLLFVLFVKLHCGMNLLLHYLNVKS